jgi:hypothetical protein
VRGCAGAAVRPTVRTSATVLVICLLAAARTFAHDIPRDVTVQSFVKPEGHTLRLLVRVPLKGIQDIEYPRKERDFVDLARADQSLRDAAKIWVADKIELYEGDTLLPAPAIVAARMSLDSDRSFVSYDAALAHVTGARLPDTTTIFWEQGLLDVLFEYPIASDRSDFSIHAAFDRYGLKVVTGLQFMPPNGASRAFELEGDAGLVRLDPSWYQAAFRFVRLGFLHILDGTDHLLFLFCLVIPFRRLWTLVPIVTSFTVAHSITLISAAYGYAPGALWFQPLIETLIAMSILYMALENIAVEAPRRRWIITFFFGLVHGFGFSFGLQHTMQFAGTHLLTSLLSFNVGVELGQLLVLAVLVPALAVGFRYVVAERMGTIILSALVAHTAWHWMMDRYDVLRMFPWPTVTAADAVIAIRWIMILVSLAGGAWAVAALTKRKERIETDVAEGIRSAS